MSPSRQGRRGRGRPDGKGREAASRRAAPTRARLLAIRVVDRVQRVRAWADLALHHALSRSGLSVADRGLTTELVYGTLRWRGRLDHMLQSFSDRPLEELEPLVLSTLRVGAYQLAFSDRIPASAAVDESVRCIRALGLDRATGLVNAVLRRFSEHHAEVVFPDLAEDPQGHLVQALSLPVWIADRWIAAYGPEEAAALARVSNEPPPLTVRANRGRCTRDELLEELKERWPEVAPCRIAPDGLVLGRKGDPGRDPAFLDGRMTVQDEAAQLVVELLDPQPGDRVLDACAAPGTKTTAIAERLGPEGEVLALDRHAGRLSLVGRAARRLGLSQIHTLERDATQSLDDLAQPAAGTKGVRGFDRILVDAPCSGLGTLRRNPDARWRFDPRSLEELTRLQHTLLVRAAAALRPGGTLVYSTCTLLPEENENLVDAFLADSRASGLLLRRVSRDELPAELAGRLAPVLDEDGSLRCLPHRHDADGFFAVRLERSA